MASLAVIGIAYHAPRSIPKFPVLSPVQVRRLLRRLYAGLKQLWLLALLERATPRGIAGSVAVGVFAGCTPFLGLHAGIALLAATLLGLNRLWAVVASRISFLPILAWIIFAEIESAHRFRTGAWMPIEVGTITAHAEEWLLDWCLGSVLVGGVLALAFGALAYVLAARRERLTPRTPAPPPPPSSGSPP